jgi:hypothetical protein
VANALKQQTTTQSAAAERDPELFIEISVQYGSLTVTVINIAGAVTMHAAGHNCIFPHTYEAPCDKGSSALVFQKL